ncbi:MAG: RdgB/HAM1 family non-canonical purine NTP pyrophosphatase [Patescibacteria group bacterium]
MKIIFATHNQGKVKEMKEILNDSKIFFEIITLDEAGIKDEIVEDGKTIEDNALKKAREISKKTGEWAIGEDSGIFITALDGLPGVKTARWGDEDGINHERLYEYCLDQMINVPAGKRQASFETALALVSPDGNEWMFKGQIDGVIAEQPKGEPRSGLPYDMVFIPEGYETTFAEMTDEEKNALSHRGKAFRDFAKFLKIKGSLLK